MKKPTVILLVLSLLANIALAIVVVRTNALSALMRGAPQTARAQAQAAPRTQAATDASIVSALKTGDTKALLALLKNAGLDDKKARFMTVGLQIQKLADDISKLCPESPYWRNFSPSPADRVKIQQLTITFAHNMKNLVDDSIPQLNGAKYNYLTPGRRDQLLALERDYNDLSAETLIASTGFRLQSDTDKLKTLGDERKREIDQFLTPDETALRDARESPAATLLRNDYGAIIDNESEYQSALAIMQAAGPDTGAGRAQVEAMLGPDRMAKLAQMNDPDYALIQTAAARLNLPAGETTASLMTIRDQAVQASAAIAADDTLTAGQRKTALQDLATQSQDQVGGVLGAEGAAAFAKSSKWMATLQKGAAFSYDTKGKFKPGR